MTQGKMWPCDLLVLVGPICGVSAGANPPWQLLVGLSCSLFLCCLLLSSE